MKTSSFKDLIVWQKAFTLVKNVYEHTKHFPREEQFCLSQQMRRAALSIPSNISEGYGRRFRKEYDQFLSIAYGSLCELETQYLLSIDLKHADRNLGLELYLDEVGRMLYRMINPLP